MTKNKSEHSVDAVSTTVAVPNVATQATNVTGENDSTSIKNFHSKINFVLTDIDDTLTNEGELLPEAYESLWVLKRAGIKVIPVTGRPAGWCEMIARFWPVSAVVGENGAFYFMYKNKKMHRHFSQNEIERSQNQKKLEHIKKEILQSVPGCALASDQFCRVADLAIDFCEDVPALPEEKIQEIVSVFTKHGAIAKVSSIHVNGWFGNHDKLTQSLYLLKHEFRLDENTIQDQCAFVGDSPNDEPMWKYFKNSLAVSNVKKFLPKLTHQPRFIANSEGGIGFAEIVDQMSKSILKSRES